MKYFWNPRTVLLLVIFVFFLGIEINKALSHSIRDIINNGEPINILLLGIDARPDEVNARSDTIIKQLLQIDTIAKFPYLLTALQENVQTNISVSDMLYLANLLLKIDDNNIVAQTLPGYAYTDPYSGASYWEVDQQISLSILDSLFHGHQYEVKLDSSPYY